MTIYGEVVYTTLSGITNTMRIRLYESECHGWVDQLIHSGILHYTTDQDIHYETNGSKQSLDKLNKVWFNGCLIYEASMWAKFVYKIKRTIQ